jgi:hypothetical protein
MAGRTPTDRYEPLPGIADLPGWAWRRMGRRFRIGAALVLVAAIALGAALIPTVRDSKEERAAADRHQRAERRARLVERLEAEQRPRFGRSGAVAPATAPPEERLAARARTMDELTAAILGDARRRVRAGQLDGPIRRVECQPFPRSVDAAGADRDLSRRSGRYSCVAVTAEFGRSEASLGGVIGHQYRTKVDFENGRYALCKIAGQSGPAREQLVTTPGACGGR